MGKNNETAEYGLTLVIGLLVIYFFILPTAKFIGESFNEAAANLRQMNNG